MPWTIGQKVGYSSRGAGAHISTPSKVFCGIVEHVTPSGRATVKFTRHDGSQYPGIFEANGRERGGGRHKSALFNWTTANQTVWVAQQADHDRKKASAKATKEAVDHQRKVDREAIIYVIEYLRGCTNERLVHARDNLLPKWMANYDL